MTYSDILHSHNSPLSLCLCSPPALSKGNSTSMGQLDRLPPAGPASPDSEDERSVLSQRISTFRPRPYSMMNPETSRTRVRETPSPWLYFWMKSFCWKCPVCGKCVSASVSQQWMLCSEWVPSEWESDKNITVIHTTLVHQLSSGEDKSSIKMFLTSNCRLWLKYESIIHNNSSSGEKVHLMLSLTSKTSYIFV